MSQAFKVTTELVYEPAHNWSFLNKTETLNEDLEVVECTEIVTGEKAFSLKAMDLIARYQAWLESERLRRIALAKRLLYDAGVS